MGGWEGEEEFEVVKHLLKERGDAGEHAELALESHDGLGESEQEAKRTRGTDHPDIRGDEEDLCGVWEEGHALACDALVFVLLYADEFVHAGEGFCVVAEWLVERFCERCVRDVWGV